MASIKTEIVVVGCRAGRICGGVLCGGPWQESHSHRAREAARRRLPESRLHPVEGAALCDAPDRQRPRIGASRHHVRRADGGLGEAARVEGIHSRRNLAAAWRTLAKMRNVQVIQGRGYFEGSQKLRVETEQGPAVHRIRHRRFSPSVRCRRCPRRLISAIRAS